MAAVIDTKPGYRVFAAVTAMRGPRLSDLASICRLPTSVTRQILDRLLASGWVHEVDQRYYVSKDGFTAIARHNRNHHQSVKPRVTQAPVSNKTKALVIEKRDKAINLVYRRFQEDGLDVWDGRRMGVGALTDSAPWFPDLWVNIRADAGRHRFVLHAVLVEPSAHSESAVKTRLRDFRTAYLMDPEERPLLVVARNETAAERFWRAGDELVMMVATYGEFLKGDLSGPNSVWRYRGERADVDRLALLVLNRPLT